MPINFFKHIAVSDAAVSRIPPPDTLKGLVEGFYVYHSHLTQKKQLFFNDGYPVVALMEKDSKLEISAAGTERWVDSIWVCSGLLKRVYCSPSTPQAGMVVIRFFPIPFYQAFDPPCEILHEHQVFSFSEIAGPGFQEFQACYYGAYCLERRLETVSVFLTARTASLAGPEILLDILDYIDKRQVNSISELAGSYGARLNYKWLERNFKKYLRLSPKNYLSIKRFLNAYIELDNSRTSDLLEIALNNGYYDDNHFIKDFRKFSGISPKSFFRAALDTD